jgi:hypothetical protein
MKGDYLWDAQGDPDQQVQRLEDLLRPFRYKPVPFRLPSRRRKAPLFVRLALAAALVLALGAGVWIGRQDHPDRASARLPLTDVIASQASKPAPPDMRQERTRALHPKRSHPPHKGKAEIGNEQLSILPAWPRFDVDTARHIERVEALLRSFRNARPDDQSLAYEREQARSILTINILLRLRAEGEGDLPLEDLLSSVEPLLLDIANLPDQWNPSEADAIRERIVKSQIIAALQIHWPQNQP